MSLQLRNKRPSAAKAKLRDDRRRATEFERDLANGIAHEARGHKLRVLTIVNIFSRFSSALVPRFFRGSDVVTMLERACKEVGDPATIRVNQGKRVRVARP
ncbi:hypothetical protein IVB11_36900 [Bradyrhizobium sp. 177]|nr:hypothetical protein [Bradyrhizobium sp. 177]